MAGYYACSRCYERVEPLAAHICADRREGHGGTVIVSDDYRDEVRALLEDAIVHDMAAGLGNVPFPDIMHDGGTPRFEFMMAANAEYRERGGKGAWSMGGVARVLIALLTARREIEAKDRIRAAREEFASGK